MSQVSFLVDILLAKDDLSPFTGLVCICFFFSLAYTKTINCNCRASDCARAESVPSSRQQKVGLYMHVCVSMTDFPLSLCPQSPGLRDHATNRWWDVQDKIEDIQIGHAGRVPPTVYT